VAWRDVAVCFFLLSSSSLSYSSFFKAFEECWVLFKRTAVLAERGPLEPGYWLQLCANCLETLRNAYRFTWTLPCTKASLAVVPHLMLGSDADVYPCFRTCAELSAESGGLAAGTVLRLARRVYWEYQRQVSKGIVGENGRIGLRVSRISIFYSKLSFPSPSLISRFLMQFFLRIFPSIPVAVGPQRSRHGRC